MPKNVDVLIIGGGVIGICTAHFLAQRGRRVLVVEKGEICSGSSYGNAGLVVPSHSMPLAEPGVIAKGLRYLMDPDSPFYIKPRLDRDLISWLRMFWRMSNQAQVNRAMPVLRDLHLESLRLFEALAGEFDFGFERRGRLLLCKTAKGLTDVAEEAGHMRALGLEAELLNGAGVRALEPSVGDGIIGGVFYPQDAHLQPAQFVRGLARRVADQGGEIWANTEVMGLRASGRKVAVVKTTRGDFAPGEVVLCGGAWSPVLAQNLRLRLLMQPAKGYSISVRAPANAPKIPVMLTEAKVAVTPMGDVLRFAGTLELAGLDLSINQRRVKAIANAAPRYLPNLGAWELVEIWRGLRPCSPDGLPYLGRAEVWDNLTVATGHAMVGISLGPITGNLAAQIAVGETPDRDMSLMAVDRFG